VPGVFLYDFVMTKRSTIHGQGKNNKRTVPGYDKRIYGSGDIF
jgi:hypothetical protein